MTNVAKEDNWKRRTRGCAALLVAFILLPLLILKGCQWADAHPSDEQLTQDFQQHRQAFDALLKMVQQERQVTRVANDFIWIDGAMTVPENERSRYLPDERFAKYKRIFKALDLESGVVRYQDGGVGFLRSSSGIVTSGSAKGYVWSPAYKGPKLATSDPRSLEEACIPKTGCSSARQIAPNWYITFESN
jgi:hypothetical protein